MTPSPDLLAVLREARDALDRITSETAEMAVILASHPDRGAAAAEDIGRVARDLQRVFTGLDSALSAHEAQGWMPIAEAPKDGRLIATWNPRQPSISRFLRWGTPNLSKDRAWITPKGCAPTYLPTQFLILPPPPEPTT